MKIVKRENISVNFEMLESGARYMLLLAVLVGSALYVHDLYSAHLSQIHVEVKELLDKFEYSNIKNGSCQVTRTNTVTLAYVTCGAGPHLNQTFVSIKSAVLFATDDLHFIIVSDKESSIWRQFFESLHILNTEVNITYEVLPPVIPDHMRSIPPDVLTMYEPCAQYRLFFPEVLNNSHVIYIDGDTIWLESPSNLWKHFNKGCGTLFQVPQNNRNSLQVAPYTAYPGPAPAGICTGVMLMDLEQMRKSNFVDVAMTFLNRKNVLIPDQTFIAVLARHSPDVFRLLPAKWNVQPSAWGHVSEGADLEEDTYFINDIAILHGSSRTFIRNQTSFLAFGKRYPLRNLNPAFVICTFKRLLTKLLPQPVYLETYKIFDTLQPGENATQHVYRYLESDYWNASTNLFEDALYLTNTYKPILKMKIAKYLM